MAKGVRNKKIEQTEAQHVLMSVKNLDLNEMVKSCGDLQLTLQNTLAGLQSQFTNKMAQLQELNEAIDLKRTRLKELHEIEDEAIRIDEIKAIKDEEERDMQARRIAREKEAQEQESERTKKWQREGEDWAYKFLQQQKKAKDTDEAEAAARKRNEEIRCQTLTKSWAEREDALKLREQELATLKTQVAGFDALLKSEVAKAEAVVSNSIKKHYEYEITGIKKDMVAAANMSALRCEAYDKTVAGLNEEIKELRTQLVAARADAKEIAASALQSASGRQVSEVLQRVMDNRETPNNKGK